MCGGSGGGRGMNPPAYTTKPGQPGWAGAFRGWGRAGFQPALLYQPGH
ncbi:MAG: hypothetical protein H6Q33_2303, partial [Deltaproteobacteria bacterium]|nr:hypothetical protein [Deltaproteobacteria bacterium]